MPRPVAMASFLLNEDNALQAEQRLSQGTLSAINRYLGGRQACRTGETTARSPSACARCWPPSRVRARSHRKRYVCPVNEASTGNQRHRNPIDSHGMAVTKISATTSAAM